jgi:hypothetical protein
MAIGDIPYFLIKRFIDGHTKSEYANPQWIGELRGRTVFENETMWAFHHLNTIIASTRLEF